MKPQRLLIALLATLYLLLALPTISFADTFIVISTSDDYEDDDGGGGGLKTVASLREAVTLANENPDHDTILFAIPGNGPHIINSRYAERRSEVLLAGKLCAWTSNFWTSTPIT